MTLGGARVRSAKDARYFEAWVDRVKEAVGAHPDWNSAQEKEGVLARLSQARAVFAERARPN